MGLARASVRGMWPNPVRRRRFWVYVVGQGSSFGVPAPGPSASSALNTAIESEVGALIGGERARQTVEDINAELRRSLTETDRPKSDGPLHRAMRDMEQWRATETESLRQAQRP